MPTARDLRLRADYEQLCALAANSGGALQINTTRGNPPDHYVLTFHCRGIERLREGKPIFREMHQVEIRLPARYPAPSASPRVRMLTPLFHPHVYPNREVCIGFWRTTDFLEDFVARLGAMIQYDRRFLDPRDPANEAAIEWAKKNLLLFPTDTQTFGQAPPPAQGPQPPAETVSEEPSEPSLPDLQELMAATQPESLSGPSFAESEEAIAPLDAADQVLWTDIEDR
ncbi:MAG TPA: ubiquitin-conjugating enzyme E2 [Chthonomonadaceae bacterium]|nr:ubiquitin-conjugating enzyme E2 [Chthonomonadaceae bacterium]